MDSHNAVQEQREQRRRELFANKSCHMAQKYLRRIRELGGGLDGSPQYLEPFFDVLERTYIRWESVDAPLGTPTIGTYCVQAPAELIYAAGAQPVKLCSGHYTAFSIGDDVVARDACPLVKAVAGFKQMGTLPIYENCSLMVVPITCDCKKKIAGLLQDTCPVHMLPVPANKEDEDVEQFVDELYGLAHAISQVTGRIMTRDSLMAAMERTGRAQFEQEWIDSTNRQVANMRHLVNNLIVLSKMEERQDDLVLTEVSLTDLAYECTLTFEQLARRQGKEIAASIGEDVCVRADEPSVRQLMTILIDNAIKYATGGDPVQIEVKRDGRSAVFLTRNSWNHDVKPQELASLFDRFVRAEQSRDRSGGADGYGLGLSIARAIAQRNNAKLEVSEDSNGRIVFRAVFRL